MKKILMTIVLCLSLCLAGCGGKESNEAKPADNNKVEEQTSKTNDKQAGDKEGEEKTSVEGVMPNDTKAYRCDYVVEVPMGISDKGQSKQLCSIKMGADYYISGSSITLSGEKESIGSEVSPQISELNLNDCYITKAYVGAQGSIDDSYAFSIQPSSENSVEDIEANIPNGVKVASDTEHPAYLTEDSRYGALFAYQVNEQYTLIIGYDGELTNKLSAEEIGQEFYDLITPVE